MAVTPQGIVGGGKTGPERETGVRAYRHSAADRRAGRSGRRGRVSRTVVCAVDLQRARFPVTLRFANYNNYLWDFAP